MSSINLERNLVCQSCIMLERNRNLPPRTIGNDTARINITCNNNVKRNYRFCCYYCKNYNKCCEKNNSNDLKKDIRNPKPSYSKDKDYTYTVVINCVGFVLSQEFADAIADSIAPPYVPFSEIQGNNTQNEEKGKDATVANKQQFKVKPGTKEQLKKQEEQNNSALIEKSNTQVIAPPIEAVIEATREELKNKQKAQNKGSRKQIFGDIVETETFIISQAQQQTIQPYLYQCYFPYQCENRNDWYCLKPERCDNYVPPSSLSASYPLMNKVPHQALNEGYASQRSSAANNSPRPHSQNPVHPSSYRDYPDKAFAEKISRLANDLSHERDTRRWQSKMESSGIKITTLTTNNGETWIESGIVTSDCLCAVIRDDVVYVIPSPMDTLLFSSAIPKWFVVKGNGSHYRIESVSLGIRTSSGGYTPVPEKKGILIKE